MKEFFEKLYKNGKEEFYKDSLMAMENNEKMFVVTANPETLMIGKENPDMNKILREKETTIVPDGIGVVKGANYLGIPINERITGVDYVAFLFGTLNSSSKKIFLYGAKEEVLQSLVKKLEEKYPNIKIVGSVNGYTMDEEGVAEKIIETKPDVVLVALGIPRQEIFIKKVIDKCDKGIFVGVGGAFDVLSDTKRRAPDIFIKLNLEWLYRVGKEPKRLSRFYKSNIKYIAQLKELKKIWR